MLSPADYQDDYEDDAPVSPPQQRKLSSDLQSPMQSTSSYSEPYEHYSPSAAPLTSRRDGGASVTSPSSYAQEDSLHKDEVIFRLKQTNASLRMRFKELSAALDKSIGVASRGSIALGAAMRQSYTSSASGDDTALLQGQIRTLYTKLDVYRKTNDQLRHQLEVTSTADHVVQLENALTEQTRQNAQLVKELNAQKKAMSLARREDRARDEHEAPETVEMRTNGLIDENRALRERVRDLTARVVAHEKAAVAKHEQYHKAATAARQFEEQVRAKEVQLKAATAQRQQQQQRGPFADMDAAAIEARLSVQVEEANQRAQAASSARNVAEQRAKDAKAALKGAQDAGDAARKQLAETQHDLRRALATIESMRMKMVQSGLSIAAYAPAATAAAATAAVVGTESQHL